MDAIMNFTVLRDDPVVSFEVSTKGAYHVMKAAAALGIQKGGSHRPSINP